MDDLKGCDRLSVIKAKRQEGKLTILTKAREMCAYTIQICKNEKNFPKRDRWLLTQPIVNEALGIMTCIRRANAVRVEIREDYLYRRSEQIKAYSHAEAMLTLMDIAYVSLGIESRRIEHWTGLVLEVEKLVQKWYRSDRARYGELLEVELEKSEIDTKDKEQAENDPAPQGA
jgi:hypothetical protein